MFGFYVNMIQALITNLGLSSAKSMLQRVVRQPPMSDVKYLRRTPWKELEGLMIHSSEILRPTHPTYDNKLSALDLCAGQARQTRCRDTKSTGTKPTSTKLTHSREDIRECLKVVHGEYQC